MTPKNNYNRTPATVRGKTYPSIRAAAKACGVCERTAQRHLDQFGHLDLLGLKQKRKRPDLCRAVNVYGMAFASQTEAAEALGVNRKTIRNMQHSKSAREFVYAACMRLKMARAA